MEDFYEKRKFDLGLIMIFLVCIFVSCDKNTQEEYEKKASKNTLRICIDVENQGIDFDEYKLTQCYEELLKEIKSGVGIQNVVLEILPGSGPDRETALHRIRTEMMAGGGPDVFILSAVGGNFLGKYEEALLNLPEKNMESGLFLPLDAYMEEYTKFTDWEAQTKAVLNAGRTEAGQVIIPLKYTFSVIVYPKNAVTIPYTVELSLPEVINDPRTKEIGAVLYTGIYEDFEQDNQYVDTSLLTYLIGKLADYKEEKLLFTENDLYEFLNMLYNLKENAEQNPYQYIREEAGYWLLHKIDLEYFDTEMALVPHYSRDGGITASIDAYTAVNRNTRFPEESFSIIDFLVQEKMQMESELYSFLLSKKSIPLQNDIGYDGKKLYMDKYFSPSMYNEFLSIKEQITEVNFKSELDMMLAALVYDSFANGIDIDHISETYEKMDRMVGE